MLYKQMICIRKYIIVNVLMMIALYKEICDTSKYVIQVNRLYRWSTRYVF